MARDGFVIGLDVGATNTKAARVRADGRCEGLESRQTPGDSSAVLDQAAHMIRELGGDSTTKIGVGSCGMIDDDGSVFDSTDTMPGWKGTRIPQELARRLDIVARHIRVENDGNVAALGEARFGAGRDATTVVMLTLGTGVGGGVVHDGRIVRGNGGMAGQLGHVRVGEKRLCACKKYGCLEAYVGQDALEKHHGCGSAEKLFQEAREGSARAQKIVDEMSDRLGEAFALLAHILNPEVIVVGGGMSRAWDQLEGRAIRGYERITSSRAAETTRPVKAKLQEPGVVGAACLHWQPASG